MRGAVNRCRDEATEGAQQDRRDAVADFLERHGLRGALQRRVKTSRYPVSCVLGAARFARPALLTATRQGGDRFTVLNDDDVFAGTHVGNDLAQVGLRALCDTKAVRLPVSQFSPSVVLVLA